MVSSNKVAPYRELILRADIEDGASLDALERSLLRVGLAASVVALDQAVVRQTVKEAYALGATPTQIQEVVSVVSGLGVHSLMVSAAAILEEGITAGYDLEAPLNEADQLRWNTRVGDDPFWLDMERELPGFLTAMLRLSPDQFDAFFDYCAVPWKMGTVKARTKELLALASDAMPAHMFIPGFKLHLANAIKLRVGRRALLESLDIAQEY